MNDGEKNFETIEEQYGRFLKDIPGGIALYQLSDPIEMVYFNNALCDVVGYSKEQYIEENKKGIASLVHPDDMDNVMSYISKVSKSYTPLTSVHRSRHGSGDYKWLKITGCLTKTHDDPPIVCTTFSDVDQEKKTEQELIDKEIVYRLATENTDINVWEYDVQNKVMKLTENSRRVHNERETVIENFPASSIKQGVIRQDCIETFRKMYDDLQSGITKTSADIWFREAEGTGWWCERIACTNIFDENGKPVRTIGIGRNVTDEHMVLEKYRQMEKKYLEEMRYHQATQSDNLIVKVRSNITKNITESYVARDENISIAFINGMSYDASVGALAQTGYTEEDRKNISLYVNRQRVLDAFNEGEEKYSVNYRRKAKDGTVFWANTTVKTYQNPDTQDVMSFMYTYNVQEEKIKDNIIQAVAAIEYDYIMYIDLKKNYYKLYLGNDDGVIMPSAHGGNYFEMMIDINKKGVVPEDLKRANYDMDPETIKENLNNRETFSGVYGAYDSEGNVFQKRIEYAYLDKANEQVLLMRSDVTDLINEQTKQQEILKSALIAAEQANSAKSDFLSRMSHEIRTPMNAIIGMATIASQSIGNDAQVSDCISKIGISSRFLLSLINDILDMSRIESGKMLLQNEKIPFEEFLNGINSICYNQVEDKGIDYENIVDPNVEDYYMGDAMKLQQVIINILSNAVKFTPSKGKISFRVRQMSKTQDTATLRFVINDTGCGISEDFLPHIFETFTQDHRDEHNMYNGTGLGLAICKNLVAMMDGHIDVRSIVGVGTEFTVDVKLGITEESKVCLGKKTHCKFEELNVLVVDDDVTVCEHAVITLNELGVKSEWVDSGKKAVDRVKEKWAEKAYYDIVLVDWKMPEMDGIETAKRIRKIVGPDVTIIIMTAYDWASIEHEAKVAGVNLLMNKPMFKASLISAFEKALSEKEGEKEASKVMDYNFYGKRILLAEDHPLNVEVAKTILESKCFEVEHAENGIRAMEMFTSSPAGYYDAILMDIRMPEMDGLQATYNIRRWRKDDAKTIPIIAMTANAFDEDVQKSKLAGMNAHLAKPIDQKLLFRTLYKFLYDQNEDWYD